ARRLVHRLEQLSKELGRFPAHGAGDRRSQSAMPDDIHESLLELLVEIEDEVLLRREIVVDSLLCDISGLCDVPHSDSLGAVLPKDARGPRSYAPPRLTLLARTQGFDRQLSTDRHVRQPPAHA